MFRVGLGFDFHPFAKGRPLVLGGVHIPHPRGLQGHSDADALLHALGDALLGAAGLNDIGSHFPDTDPEYENISSLVLLERIRQLVRGQGFEVVNVDMVVVAESPRIGPHVELIRQNLSQVLGLSRGAIGVKATTMEACGPIGKGEGIAVQAVALLQDVNEPIRPN